MNRYVRVPWRNVGGSPGIRTLQFLSQTNPDARFIPALHPPFLRPPAAMVKQYVGRLAFRADHLGRDQDLYHHALSLRHAKRPRPGVAESLEAFGALAGRHKARQQLDGDTFAKAWAAGQALSEDDAVSYATRARGQRRRPTAGWLSLTPTETAVIELLAEGLTNPQIAERLFISRATVKTHLIHIFNKLGVTTRSQLAAEATRRTIR